MLERPLRALSIVAVVVVALGFVLFAVRQGTEGSTTQQRAVDGTTTVQVGEGASGVRRAIDRANEVLLAPFEGAVDGSESTWVRRGVPSVLALLVYGLGLATVARYARGRPWRRSIAHRR